MTSHTLTFWSSRSHLFLTTVSASKLGNLSFMDRQVGQALVPPTAVCFFPALLTGVRDFLIHSTTVHVLGCFNKFMFCSIMEAYLKEPPMPDRRGRTETSTVPASHRKPVKQKIHMTALSPNLPDAAGKTHVCFRLGVR